MEWCSSQTAIAILRRNGVIHDDEAERFSQRELATSDAWYTDLYKFAPCTDMLGCERRADHSGFHYSKASGWWGFTENAVAAS